MMKYGSLTLGQIEALLNKLGGEEVVPAILRGDKEIKVRDVLQRLFDKNGRRIPPRKLQGEVCDPNLNCKFYPEQPRLVSLNEYNDRLVRFQEAFRLDSVMSAGDFQDQATKLLETLKNDERLSTLLQSVHLPIILPQLSNDEFNYGTVLEETYLAAVEQAYKKQFPDRGFQNCRKGELVDGVLIVSGSRHHVLIEKMKQGPVVAIYFPNSLQGYSVNASREQMVTLSEGLLLAGGFDTATAVAMYPDVLAQNFNAPGLDLAALFWHSVECSLFFRVHVRKLGFDSASNLAYALSSDSTGLLFLG